MPYGKETDLFVYHYWELRSINLAFAEAKGDKDIIYWGGIDFYKRGTYRFTETRWREIAEYIADYTRACEACRVTPNRKIGHRKIQEMLAVLNGNKD